MASVSWLPRHLLHLLRHLLHILHPIHLLHHPLIPHLRKKNVWHCLNLSTTENWVLKDMTVNVPLPYALLRFRPILRVP